ncbi:MAG: dephospho-CoA kinase [Vulcanococcus sp.]
MTHPSWKRWQGSQRRIGLTGGIATGKSTVGRWLAEQGLPVLDADLYAREALAAGSAGARAVLDRYGDSVRSADSEPTAAVLDRAALGAIVFAQPSEKDWLEALVHPLVRARFEQELSDLQEQPTVVLMIPLLFEAGLEELCSEIWLVDCEPTQQLERLMQRDGLSERDARARIAAQWPMTRKRDLSDLIISNQGDTKAFQQQLIARCNELCDQGHK